LGILIVSLQVQPANTIYIRACLHETHTIIFVEAAAIALAVALLNDMDFQQVTFLSDCAQLVSFLNSQDHSNPPDWRMKIHTQMFDASTFKRRPQINKIDRNLNCTPDTLATLAFSSPAVQFHDYVPSYSYEHHGHQRPLLGALTSVSLLDTMRIGVFQDRWMVAPWCDE
jgi:hypothetical protein